MRTRAYQIEVNWDEEARMWIAECSDLPGLLTEAESVEAMIEKLKIMVPETVSLLHEEVGVDERIPFEVHANRTAYAFAE